MGKTTISVLGACVSRDIFGIARPDSYDIPRCVTIASPISMVLDKPNDGYCADVEKMSDINISGYMKRTIMLDCNKKVFDYLAQKKSNYLIFDVADIRFNIESFNKSGINVTMNEHYKRNLDKFRDLFGNDGTVIKSFDFSDEEIEKYINLYVDNILNIYKPEEIIFNEYYCVKDYLSRKNAIEHLKYEEYIVNANRLISVAVKIIKKRIPECHIIKMPENCISDEKHKWGRSSLHYVDLFYEYAGKAVDIITAKKTREEENAELQKLYETFVGKFDELRKKFKSITGKELISADGSQIVFPEVGKAEFVPLKLKPLGSLDVEVKTVYTLISNGTEKDYISGSQNTGRKFPYNIGYSAVGIVEKTGNSVKSVKPGDRVFVEYGGHSSVIVKDVHNVIKIPDNVSFEEAVFAKLASYPLAAIRRARLEIGESIVIVGLGMLGLFGVQLAKCGGAFPIIAVGNREIRKELALKYGADYVFAPNEPDLTKKIYDITDNKTFIHGASVIVETSGSESGLLKCLEYTAMNARVMLNGCNRVMKQPIDFYKYVHTRGVNIVGVHNRTRPQSNSAPGNWTSKRDMFTILQFISKGRLDTKSIISEYVSPKNAEDVYKRLLNDRDFPLGVIFDWTKI